MPELLHNIALFPPPPTSCRCNRRSCHWYRQRRRPATGAAGRVETLRLTDSLAQNTDALHWEQRGPTWVHRHLRGISWTPQWPNILQARYRSRVTTDLGNTVDPIWLFCLRGHNRCMILAGRHICAAYWLLLRVVYFQCMALHVQGIHTNTNQYLFQRRIWIG